jgi:hypothetical protein
MEGKLFCFAKKYRIELIGSGFFLLSLIAAVFLSTYLLPSNTSQSILPKQYVKHPDPAVRDFYTKEGDCRISIDTHEKSDQFSLDEWIDLDAEQLSALTVLSREKKRINEHEKKIVYTVTTKETEMSKIYYEDRGNQIFEMRVFGESQKCYKDFEKFILHNNS